ncbi:MAG: alcohol dehydrogenase [Desulfuromonadaceae bacterium GWC2_58_13]|nr:MAG: alcohol dehydrogenase [Desulfuromonadaceae bacterium GWC2_58_13]
MVEGLELRKFVAPEFIFGVGARRQAGRYARNLGARKLLVVTDPGVIAAGWTKDVTDSIEQAGLPYTIFSGVSPNPRAEEVMTGAEIYREQRCNAILAVGGGSPMDCAKGIGIVSSNQRHILTFEGVDQVEMPMPPLICIPTTGGTSADVSQFAIINDTAERTKIAIVSKAVLPDLALIDPLTLTTTGPYLTACTGMDALTHAIEAFVSNAHSPMTDLHALQAIRQISAHLVDSVNQPDNLELRSQIMQGSLLAGLAFSNAILGANHAMAHSLGGYLDLAHGECNAILLDHVIEFNLRATPERFEQIAAAMGLDQRGLTSREKQRELLAAIRTLKSRVGVDRHLKKLGVSRSDLASLSRNALKDPCMVTNPRQPDQRDVEVIFEEAL